MKTIALILLTGLLLAACALRPYQPVPDSGYAIENRYAIVQADSLLIILRPQAYTGNAQSVNNNFFTLYLRVRNLGRAPVRLARESFGIIADGDQYDYFPLELVLGSIQSNYWLTQYEDPFALPGTVQNQTLSQEKAQEQYFELLNNYFSFGDILPGGSKEGYLFYNRRVNNSRQFSVDVRGREVVFRR